MLLRRTTIITAGLMIFAAFAGVSRAQDACQGNRRIVGGEKTDIKEHPWQIALSIDRPNGSYLCGGSLIAEKWILTAAHSFYARLEASRVRAKVGETQYSRAGSWSQVEKIIVHKGYNPSTQENDIALVKLNFRPAETSFPWPIRRCSPQFARRSK